MIYDVIYSLFVLIEKLTFFNKQFSGFIVSLRWQFETYKFNPCRVIYWKVKYALALFDNEIIKIRHLHVRRTLPMKMDFLFNQKYFQ